MTICTHNRANHFGEIDKDQMKFSDIGQIATDCWQHIPEHSENTALDEFVVMPHHIHGIIILVWDADLRPIQQQTADRSESLSPTRSAESCKNVTDFVLQRAAWIGRPYIMAH